MITQASSLSVAVALISAVLVGSAQDTRDASELVRQLAQFPAAIDARIQSDSGLPMPAEQQRADIYAKLLALADRAQPALQSGLTDADVQVRRNVALYLAVKGASYVKPAPLNLKPFLAELVVTLRDSDTRVKELAAQALAYVGADAAIAVPDLIRLLEDPGEGVRNSACIGLAGIGPAARDALPALRRALSDPSNDVRRFAQRAIEKIQQ
jgi:HEAT repeat protein